MVCDIHTTITLCELPVTVHSISLANVSVGSVRKYYQHRHPGFEIHYVTAGRFQIQSDVGTMLVEPGMMLMIPPGTYHDVLDPPIDGARISICFGMDQSRGTKDGSRAALFDRCFDRNASTLVNLKDSACIPVLEKMEFLLTDGREDPYRKDKLLLLCCELLLELAGLITETKQSVYPAKAEAPDADFVIDSFLGRNFMSNNAMERMAEELHVSTRQLRRIIQKRFGVNYRQKLSETRIRIAMDMLCNTDMPIHAIAEALGYKSATNFSTFLKRHTQKSPAQIRKDSKNNCCNDGKDNHHGKLQNETASV